MHDDIPLALLQFFLYMHIQDVTFYNSSKLIEQKKPITIIIVIGIFMRLTNRTFHLEFD